MEDISPKDLLINMEAENKILKEELISAKTRIQALEKANNHLNKVFREIQKLAEVAGVQNDQTVNNTMNVSVARSGFQSSAGLVVTDSSKRAQDAILLPGTDHQYDSPTLPGEEATTTSSGSKCQPLVFKTLSWFEKMKIELRKSQDEQRLHHFLCKAITTHASALVSEGFGLQASDFPDRLVSRGCVTEEECSKFLNSSNKHINLMRVILARVIRRDCNTLLSFIDILFQYNEFLAKEITQTFDNITRGQDEVLEAQACSHCLLRERVEPVLIIDKLITNDHRKWLPLYEQATRWDNMPEKRASLWDMFTAQVNNDGAFADMVSLTIEALEACGFHSDIVKNLRDDLCIGVNSFMCRHTHLPEETLECSNEVKNDVSEPRMHEINLKLADDENTNLKQIFPPMIQNVPTESDGNKMQELKSCEFESHVDATASIGTREQNNEEQTNNGRKNGSNNSSCAILFVKDSNITIVKREDS